RIVDDRREEIERLHQRQIIAQSIHYGVIRFVETDQQIRIVWLSLEPAQHLSEDLRRQLGRSTRARNHLSQTHLDSSFSHRYARLWRALSQDSGQHAGGVRTASFSAAAPFT